MSSVVVDGQTLDPSQYSILTAKNGIQLAQAPSTGASIVINYTTRTAVFRFDLGTRVGVVGINSFVAGKNNEASGYDSSVSGGGSNRARKSYSHVGGGSGNHADSDYTFVGGGNANKATEMYAAIGGGVNSEAGFCGAVAGGNQNKAGNAAGVGGGIGNKANAQNSFAAGFGNIVDGSYSTVFGENNESKNPRQFVFGRYNDAMAGHAELVEIVGNGTNTSLRSNARTLDWNGNEKLAGDVFVRGGTRLSPLHVTIPSFSSLPITFNNARITSFHRVFNASFGTPTAVPNELTYTTTDGSITISGIVVGSTTLEFDLIPSFDT